MTESHSPNVTQSLKSSVLRNPQLSVVRTQHFHYHGPGVHPWSGEQDPASFCGMAKNKQTKSKN